MSRLRIRWNDHKLCWEAVEGFRPVAWFAKCHDAERWVEAEMKRREVNA